LCLIALETAEVDSYASGQRPISGSCEHGNEPSSYTNGEEFFDRLSDY